MKKKLTELKGELDNRLKQQKQSRDFCASLSATERTR